MDTAGVEYAIKFPLEFHLLPPNPGKEGTSLELNLRHTGLSWEQASRVIDMLEEKYEPLKLK